MYTKTGASKKVEIQASGFCAMLWSACTTPCIRIADLNRAFLMPVQTIWHTMAIYQLDQNNHSGIELCRLLKCESVIFLQSLMYFNEGRKHVSHL